jgi:ribosomal-protein-serine acetyltransferase
MFTVDLDQRSHLRLFERSDTEALHEVIEANRAMLAEWMPWAREQTLDDTRGFIDSSRRRSAADDGFEAVIIDRGEIAGGIGFARMDHANRSASLGYWLASSSQGRGIVTRATVALLDHAFGTWQLNRVEIRAGTGNARSRAVPERLGFTQEGVLRESERLGDRWVDQVVYAMLARDWVAHRPGDR